MKYWKRTYGDWQLRFSFAGGVNASIIVPVVTEIEASTPSIFFVSSSSSSSTALTSTLLDVVPPNKISTAISNYSRLSREDKRIDNVKNNLTNINLHFILGLTERSKK